MTNSKIIQVKVKPNSKKSEFKQQSDGSFVANLKSPPVDGKANKELIALVAKHFSVTKSNVELKLGATSKLKLVLIKFP